MPAPATDFRERLITNGCNEGLADVLLDMVAARDHQQNGTAELIDAKLAEHEQRHEGPQSPPPSPASSPAMSVSYLKLHAAIADFRVQFTNLITYVGLGLAILILGATGAIIAAVAALR